MRTYNNNNNNNFAGGLHYIHNCIFAIVFPFLFSPIFSDKSRPFMKMRMQYEWIEEHGYHYSIMIGRFIQQKF